MALDTNFAMLSFFILVGQKREGPAHHSLHHWPGTDLQPIHESQVSLSNNTERIHYHVCLNLNLHKHIMQLIFLTSLFHVPTKLSE